jgi:hypothetical protein
MCACDDRGFGDHPFVHVSLIGLLHEFSSALFDTLSGAYWRLAEMTIGFCGKRDLPDWSL